MTREAINLTMSEPLRRAQVPQRLDALAKITGLAQAQLAGRALTIGLGHIEKDLSQIFPGVADKPSPTEPGSPAPSSPAQSMAGRSEAQPGAATQRMEAQHSAPSRTPEPEPAPPPLAAHGAPLPPDEKPDHAPQHPEPPRPESTKLLSAQDAAQALGYGTKAAFLQHVQRHPELKRCGRKSERSTEWDLGKLRAEYERKGWAPR